MLISENLKNSAHAHVSLAEYIALIFSLNYFEQRVTILNIYRAVRLGLRS